MASQLKIHKMKRNKFIAALITMTTAPFVAFTDTHKSYIKE